MARAVFRISVEHGERFKRLSRDLKEAGDGQLQRKLRRGIRNAGKPVVADVQRAARGVQVSSTKGGHAPPDTSTGLRKRVADATTISVRQNGIRIRVASKKVGPDGRRLSKYLDAYGSYARWWHPVFGNRNVSVAQEGQQFFGVTIRKHVKDFRKAIGDVMDDVENKIN